MSVEVKWFGDEILKQLEEGLPDALFAAGEKVLEVAQGNVPVRSGDLRDSGYVAVEGKSTYKPRKVHRKEIKPPKGGAVVGFAAFYSRYVEFGTKKLRARPFLRPAVDELKDQIGDTIAVELRKKLK